MSLFWDLIEVVGLDTSFYYQLLLAVALYFVSKKLFFQPYLKSFEKRKELTRGRATKNKKREEEIEEKKQLYEKKAKELNQKFQEVFSKIKKSATDKYLKESLELQETQKKEIFNGRAHLLKEIKKQELNLEKDIPLLAELLSEKIKN